MYSTKGRYALRVMIDIALFSANDFVSIKEISERQNISVKYLERIIALLNAAGFLKSMRGNKGGYKLAKKPSEYTAGDILRAAEGNIAPIACLSSDEKCTRRGKCTTISFWEGYFDAVNSYVDSVTLQDLVDGALGISDVNPAAEGI